VTLIDDKQGWTMKCAMIYILIRTDPTSLLAPLASASHPQNGTPKSRQIALTKITGEWSEIETVLWVCSNTPRGGFQRNRQTTYIAAIPRVCFRLWRLFYHFYNAGIISLVSLATNKLLEFNNLVDMKAIKRFRVHSTKTFICCCFFNPG